MQHLFMDLYINYTLQVCIYANLLHVINVIYAKLGGNDYIPIIWNDTNIIMSRSFGINKEKSVK